jgi:SAM-dependent methyltransferase
LADFDEYAHNYRDIINKVSRLSGEEYEFFIELRLDLMRAKLAAIGAAPSSALDFGCGTGKTELYMEQSFTSVAIRGVDMSLDCIRAARELPVTRTIFDVLDSDYLPYGDSIFDLIYTNGTIHHIPREKHSDVLSELYRVLRPGGHVFIFENNPLNPLMMRAMRKNPFDTDAKVVYPDYLRNITEQAGFFLQCVNYYFFFPRALRMLRSFEKYLAHVPLGAQYFLWCTK